MVRKTKNNKLAGKFVLKDGYSVLFISVYTHCPMGSTVFFFFEAWLLTKHIQDHNYSRLASLGIPAIPLNQLF